MRNSTNAVARTRDAFDTVGFYTALDTRRREQGLSWRQLASAALVPQPGIGSSLAHGRQPAVGTLALLLRWMGDTDLAPYIIAPAGAGPDRQP